MENLKYIVSKALDIPQSAVIPTMSMKNTPSWDSLTQIMLITDIEKEYKIKFEYDEAIAVSSFAEMVKLITSKGVDLQE